MLHAKALATILEPELQMRAAHSAFPALTIGYGSR